MIPGPSPPSDQNSYYDYAYPGSTQHHQHPNQQQAQQTWSLHHHQQQPSHSYAPTQMNYAHQAPHYYPGQRPQQLPQSYNAGPTTTVPIQRAVSSSAPGDNQQHRATKRKRMSHPAPASLPESDNEDGDLEEFLANGGISVGMGGIGINNAQGSRGVGRLPGACTHCKKLKMKCEFSRNTNTCRRCQTGGHVCIVEGRKPRTAPNKREYLLAQIRQKDAIIESLLKQLHNPYVATPLSIAAYKMASGPSDERKDDVVGWLEKLESSLRSDRQFAASPSLETSSPPSPSTVANTINVDPYKPRPSTSSIVEGTGALSFAQKHYPGLTPPRQTESDDEGEEHEGQEDEDDNEEGGAEEYRTSLPDSTVPLGLIANLSLGDSNTSSRGGSPEVHKKSGGGEESSGAGKKKGGAAGTKQDGGDAEEFDDENIGVANEGYFQPGPAMDLAKRAMMIEQHSPPEILVHGLVAPKDVDILFQTFYEKVNPFLGLLDPVLHTPATTFARCPFLFTVICAVSSRYYPPKAEIYPIAMHFAKHAAANALIDGWKTVELCQAYILMSVYAVPARRWEEDRSWLYTGLAIRIATDLNLHLAPTIKPSSSSSLPPPPPSPTPSTSSSGTKGKVREKEIKEREILNKTRVWMICFNMDRSTATQFGKPFTIKDDFITLSCAEFYTKSPYNDPYDVHLAAYTALLQIVSRFHEEIFSNPRSPSGLNKKIDFRTVTLAHDVHLTNYHQEWTRRFAEGSDENDPACKMRTCLLPFLVSYSRLVMFSFGFQHAFKRGMVDEDRIFFVKCLDSATQVIKVFLEKLIPTGYMRFAPDGHFIFTSFASAFLLKLLRPEFSTLLTEKQEQDIFELIGKLIQTLSSAEIAIDDRHTPKLYARFLASLLSRYRRSEHSSHVQSSVDSGSGAGSQHHPGPAQFGGFGGSGFSGSGFGSGGSTLHPQGGYGAFGAGGYNYGSGTPSTSGGSPSPRASAVSHLDPQASAPQRRQSSLYGQQQAYSAPSSDTDSVVVTPPDTTGVSSGLATAAPPDNGAMNANVSDNAAYQIGYHQQPQAAPMNALGLEDFMTTQSDEATLAAMGALKNPAWWDNMMMPGFSWPESPFQAQNGASPNLQSVPPPQPSPFQVDGHMQEQQQRRLEVHQQPYGQQQGDFNAYNSQASESYGAVFGHPPQQINL